MATAFSVQKYMQANTTITLPSCNESIFLQVLRCHTEFSASHSKTPSSFLLQRSLIYHNSKNSHSRPSNHLFPLCMLDLSRYICSFISSKTQLRTPSIPSPHRTRRIQHQDSQPKCWSWDHRKLIIKIQLWLRPFTGGKYEKVPELYCLDVLPRLGEWEMRMELLVTKECTSLSSSSFCHTEHYYQELHLTLEAQLAHALNSRRWEAQKPKTLPVTVLSLWLSIPLTNHSMTFYYILSYNYFSLDDFFLTLFHLFKLRLNPLIYTFTSTLVLFNLTYADQGLQSTA